MISQTAIYALRIMTCMVQCDHDELVRTSDLAEATSIPPAYMAKIVKQLVGAGLLGARKGRGGGLWLSKAPEDILVGDVLAAIDGQPCFEGCAFGWPRCDPEVPCPMHDLWSEWQELVGKWTNHTLTQLCCAVEEGGALSVIVNGTR